MSQSPTVLKLLPNRKRSIWVDNEVATMTPISLVRERDTDVAVGLPVSWYFDPAVLELERRELFAAGPTYAGHGSMVREEGDYVALGAQQSGRLLVRHEGQVHLLSNVCRHRQAQLVSGSGRVKNIVCPIHNWTYNLDGSQIAAPHFSQNPCLDLPKTELTEWNGLLFSGPRDVRWELAPLAGWSELAGRDVVLERVDEELHDLNWKAFLEVYLEDYHVGVIHPGFRAFVDPADLKGSLQTAVGERFCCERVSVRWPLPTAGSPLFAEYQRILLDVCGGRRPEFAAVWFCLFPGQLIEWYPYSLVVTTYQPLSPTRTRLRSEYFFDRTVAETRRDYVEAGLAVLDEVTAEDHEAAERFQQGRQALFDRGDNFQGPYQGPMEQGLRRFHDCLRGVVAAAH
jgi:phenylpropionate dioxygenase-like ring-hydroxylating dioxygenase large terminal subunit